MRSEGICTRVFEADWIHHGFRSITRSSLVLDFDSDVYNYVDTFEAGVDQFANATISYSKKLSVASTKPVGWLFRVKSSNVGTSLRCVWIEKQLECAVYTLNDPRRTSDNVSEVNNAEPFYHPNISFRVYFSLTHRVSFIAHERNTSGPETKGEAFLETPFIQ